jgi:hypothetical protein
MSIGGKFAILAAVVAGCLLARECLLLGAGPTHLADLSVRQLDNSDESAEALRLADGGKNWLLSGWPVLVVAGATAAGLFGGDVARAWRKAHETEADRPS